jgi:hypothetical protein
LLSVMQVLPELVKDRELKHSRDGAEIVSTHEVVQWMMNKYPSKQIINEFDIRVLVNTLHTYFPEELDETKTINFRVASPRITERHNESTNRSRESFRDHLPENLTAEPVKYINYDKFIALLLLCSKQTLQEKCHVFTMIIKSKF